MISNWLARRLAHRVLRMMLGYAPTKLGQGEILVAAYHARLITICQAKNLSDDFDCERPFASFEELY